MSRVFEEVEKPMLLPLPASRFELFHEALRHVNRDGHVQIKGAYYSAPPEYLGQDPAVVAALRSKGVSQTQIDDMISKGDRPDGWEVHHKKPIQWGGDNSQDNFILLPANPHHRSLTDEQGILTDQAKLLGLTDQPGSNEFEMTWVELPGRFMLE